MVSAPEGGARIPVTEVRPARLADVDALADLINAFAERELMLARTKAELYENVRDFQVLDAGGGGLAGSVALHIYNLDLGELKSLAVAPEHQGRGLGRTLVEACCDQARLLGLTRVFTLTYQTGFFARLGFAPVNRSNLPEKVWGECVRCNKFLDCDEVALWRRL